MHRAVEASAHFLDSLSAQLEAAIAGARQDLLSQCERSFAHGTLLALRYTVSARGVGAQLPA